MKRSIQRKIQPKKLFRSGLSSWLVVFIGLLSVLSVSVAIEQCPTILYSTDATLSGTNGINVWDKSCTIGSDITLLSGKTAKIKKISSMSGELVLDREATNLANGRHFNVYGALEIEGVTLTK